MCLRVRNIVSVRQALRVCVELGSNHTGIVYVFFICFVTIMVLILGSLYVMGAYFGRRVKVMYLISCRHP